MRTYRALPIPFEWRWFMAAVALMLLCVLAVFAPFWIASGL